MMDSEAHEKRPPILTSSKQDISPHITNVGEMKHYLCGCCAAFNNVAITFPIQKVLFRQQLYGIKTRDAILQLRRDGFRNLYRGILPPLMQKTTTLALMFGLYEDLSCLLHKHVSAPEFATCGVAAVLAGTTEAIFTPLERVQTLLQDHKHHDKFTNTYQAFKALKCHGIGEYYRGLVPILFRNGLSNVLFFGLRGPIKEHLPTATTHSAHLVNDFICGGLLGAMLGFLFFPINVVKTRIQSQIGGEFQSFPKVFQKIWLERDRKLINLFRGAHLNYHRSLISWGIINATYEFLLKVIWKIPSVKCHFINWIDLLRRMQFDLFLNWPNTSWCHDSRAQWVMGKAIFLQHQQNKIKGSSRKYKVFCFVLFSGFFFFFLSLPKSFRLIAWKIAVHLMAFDREPNPQDRILFLKPVLKSPALKHKWLWLAREKVLRGQGLLKLPLLLHCLLLCPQEQLQRTFFIRLKHMTKGQNREDKQLIRYSLFMINCLYYFWN